MSGLRRQPRARLQVADDVPVLHRLGSDGAVDGLWMDDADRTFVESVRHRASQYCTVCTSNDLSRILTISRVFRRKYIRVYR